MSISCEDVLEWLGEEAVKLYNDQHHKREIAGPRSAGNQSLEGKRL